LVHSITDCTSFLDYGFDSEIMVANDMYEDFFNLFGSIMTIAVMSDYEWRYNKMNKSEHSIKLIKDGQRAFTINIYNNIDKYNSTLELTIYYHFHSDFSKNQLYKGIFKKMYSDEFMFEDNSVILVDKKQIIDGLSIFNQIIANN
jgi:hypothetical protein